MSQVTQAEPNSAPLCTSSSGAHLCLVHRTGVCLSWDFVPTTVTYLVVISWSCPSGDCPAEGESSQTKPGPQGGGHESPPGKGPWYSCMATGTPGRLNTIGQACTGSSYAQKLPQSLQPPSGVALDIHLQSHLQLLGPGRLGGSMEPFQSLISPKTSLGVRRPSYGLVVWPWVGTLSSSSLSFPNYTFQQDSRCW